MQRRDFLKQGAALAAGGALMGCARIHRATNAQLPLSEKPDGYLLEADAVKVGVATLVYTKTGPVVLTRIGDTIKAYESVCPHTACELNDGEREQPIKGGEVRCWIHDSYFKPGDGGYISGPARPGSHLPDFPIRIEAGKVYRG
jgi:nitrite reductase/ring-hydroxylating ferredoxin subunit